MDWASPRLQVLDGPGTCTPDRLEKVLIFEGLGVDWGWSRVRPGSGEARGGVGLGGPHSRAVTSGGCNDSGVGP